MTTSVEANAIMSTDPSEVLLVTSDDTFIKDFTADTNLIQFAMRALQITATVAVATTPPSLPVVPGINSLSKSKFNATDRYNQQLIVPSEMIRGVGAAAHSIKSSGPPAVITNGPPAAVVIATAVEITLEEVRQHDSIEDCWIVVYDRVYDITDFLRSHPGGYDVILENAGRDATFAFRGSGHSPEAVQMLKKFEIGILPMRERLYRHETLIFRYGDLPE